MKATNGPFRNYYCLLLHQDATPEDVIITFRFGAPESVPTASTALTTSMPSTTSPNTTCISSSHPVTCVVMKNCFLLLSQSARSYLKKENKNLGSVRVRTRVGHGKQTRPVMLQLKVLIYKNRTSGSASFKTTDITAPRGGWGNVPRNTKHGPWKRSP